MSEKLFDALETCLKSIERGETVDAALSNFPLLAEDLRPMLETSSLARTLGGSTAPEGARQRGRLRLLQHAAEIGQVKPVSHRTWLYNLRPLAIAFMVLIFFLGGTGLVHASSESLPGDNLYPVKRAWEGMRLLLTVSDEKRENLMMEYGIKRLEETDDLLAESRAESITFSGVITAMSDTEWVVSGIPVSFNAQTVFPKEPVSIGSAVTIDGMTTLDGIVDANNIKIVSPGTPVPTPKPEEGGNELEGEEPEGGEEGGGGSEGSEEEEEEDGESSEDSSLKKTPLPEGVEESETESRISSPEDDD